MVRLGVIGSNFIVDRFIEASQAVNQVEITANYSRTMDTGQKFAAKHGITHTFTTLEQLLICEHVDAVYVASPTSLHAEHAIAAMNAGKHVLCEKPLASNTAEVERMMQAARANNVLFMEALKSTVSPAFHAIRNHLESIGPVRRMFANYCQYSSRYDAYKEGRILNAFNPQLSNGALMDIGIYCVYPAIALFGKPKRIQAEGKLLSSGVDGQGSILLGYDELDVVIHYSKIADSQLPSEIIGEQGTIRIDSISEPGEVTLTWRSTKETVTIAGKDADVPYMSYEIAEFVQLIERGERESSFNAHRYSVNTIEVLDEARRQLGVRYPADE